MIRKLSIIRPLKRLKDRKLITLLLGGVLIIAACGQAQESPSKPKSPPQDQADSVGELPIKEADKLRLKTDADIITGAARFSEYIDLLKGKKIGLVANPTSQVAGTHLVDTLIAQGITINCVFAPEHGFRGKADAGEWVGDGKDPKTGVPLVSLYGRNKKPSPQQLSELDLIVFDIQDVGARFYTYIYTMTYVMEACAENNLPFLVLDRPNPTGYYVDGPVLEMKHKSFIGMHPIPLVHGMTVGEYAQMVNGEGWLKNGVKCDLTVITCADYDHKDRYQLPVKPSPNLPDMKSIYLYPSLALFEGTVISLGRGTSKPFQVYGHSKMTMGDYNFTPESLPGAKNPPQLGKACRGVDLSGISLEELATIDSLNLNYVFQAYESYPDPSGFFLSNGFFKLLSGTSQLKEQIEQGVSRREIRESWQKDLEAFKSIRKKYLFYEDFE